MADLQAELLPIAADPARGPEVIQLVRGEVERLISELGADSFGAGIAFTAEELLRRVTAYQELSEPLGRALAVLGYWAPTQTGRACCDLISAVVSSSDRGNGVRVWLDLYAYPAQLLFYAFGLGAVAAARHDNVVALFTQPVQDRLGRWHVAALELHNQGPLAHEVAKALPELARRHTPASDWLFGVLRPWLRELVPSDAGYERAFDRFEVLVGLAYLRLDRGPAAGWAPTGRFTWRGTHGEGVEVETLAEFESNPDRSPLTGTLFDSGAELAEAAKRYRQLMAEVARHQF